MNNKDLPQGDKKKEKDSAIQRLIDNGSIDTDPICDTELFRELKFAIAGFQFQHLSMNEAKTAIEANPATHRIAKYVYNKLATAAQPDKVQEKEIEPVEKTDGVEFAEWLKENGWQSINVTMHDTTETKTVWSSKWGKGQATSKELYTQFKQQTS